MEEMLQRRCIEIKMLYVVLQDVAGKVLYWN